MIGGEYTFLGKDKDKDKSKKKPRIIPEQLSEEQRAYIYRNRKGKVIYTPLYQKYNEGFMNQMAQELAMKTRFREFMDTSIHERFMLNSYQFSAAKSAAEAKLMQAQIFDENGVVRSYSDFSRRAREITDVTQDTWLRVEYDMCHRQAVQGAQFNRMRDDADLYPYWVYRGRMDSRERPEHRMMEGLTFLIGDAAGDACFPPVDWNCRCNGVSEDGRTIDEDKVLSGQAARDWLEGEDKDGHSYVDPQFRYNPADQGMMPKEHHSYFEVLPNANEVDAEMFGLDTAAETVKQKAQAETLMERAEEAAPDLEAVGKMYASQFDGTVSPTNFKSEESILRKVNTELGGDFDQVKDAVRNTVVVSYDKLEQVVQTLRADPAISRVKVQDGPFFYGYKGIIANIKAKNGLTVEMQVLSPGMIYAKMDKETAIKLIGEAEYDRIAQETGLEGGLGHKYYEEIRTFDSKDASKADEKRHNQLIKESKAYYEKFYGF